MSNVLSVKTWTLSKRKNSAIALALVLTIAAMLITSLPVPVAQAKSTSYAYVSVIPKTSQLGSYVLINAWISPVPPSAYMAAPSADTFRDGHYFIFTKPNGSNVTIGPKSAYADGSLWFTYKPTTAGNWSVVLEWAGDDDFEGVVSEPYYFEVTEEAIEQWPDSGLPTGYWTRPVNAENRQWSQLLADWPMSGYDARNSNYNPYSPSPDTAHVLWTQEVGIGGIMGGENSAAAFRSTTTPVVMGGNVYYSLKDGIHCIDLYTGETQWVKVISGTLFYVTCVADQDPGSAATHADIWASQTGQVQVYDAFNGALTKTMTDSGVGISKYHNGYFYYLSGSTFTKWDPYGGYLDVGRGANFTTKTVWSVTLQSGLAKPSLYWKDIATDSLAQVAYNLTTGELMWNLTRDAAFFSNWAPQISDGKLFHPDINMRWHAYDLYNNGEEVWESEPSEYPWGSFWTYNAATDDVRVYGTSYDGHIYAYSVGDGTLQWSFYSGDSGGETPYGTWPFWGATTVAGGTVFASTTEHTPTQPMHRGNYLYALSDSDGTELWKISGAFGAKVVADGMLLSSNEYDSTLYCFGKGPSETTVTASAGVGSTVTIQGTVVDASAGAKALVDSSKFSIVPAVSDADMSAWMEYLYMQKAMPTDATGVSVTLYICDQSGNVVDTIQTTSDISGHYAVAWTPTSEGLFTVTAAFDGTNSYYASTAETSIAVGSSPSASIQPTVTPTPTSAPTASENPTPSASQPENPTGGSDTMLYVAVVAVIVIAVIAAAALLLRRRK